jgi:hypothetical protein
MPRRACSVTILPRINDIPGFGFAETVTRDDGSIQRSGVLEFRSSGADRLCTAIENGVPLIYAGPVCVNGAWVEQSFAVTMTPAEPTDRPCVRFAIAECGIALPSAPVETSEVAA